MTVSAISASTSQKFQVIFRKVAKISVMQWPIVKAVTNLAISPNFVRKNTTPKRNSRWS